MIDVKDINCNYGNIEILKNISFETGKGECIGIIGPNGSGKSTLLKALSKVIKPSSGSVVFLGKDLKNTTIKELARSMAVVPQDTVVDFEFTVKEIVLMGRNPHIGRFDIEGKKDNEIARASMELTGTWVLRDRKISELSGGERQRVIIARALTQEPGVLLLDEPVSHLDINHQIEILELLKRLKEERGLVVVAVLHDLNLAARYCDRLILLHDKCVKRIGRPEDVLTRESIRETFKADVMIRRHPLTGYLYVTLLSSIGAVGKSSGKTVHLISGAGTGTQAMYALHSRGFTITAGVLNVLDSDHETAVQLGIKVISEAPFSPITPESYAQNIQAMKTADVIVLANVPVGWGNLKNVEALCEMAGKKPIFIIEGPENDIKDFTGGKAASMMAAIKSKGAVTASNIESLLNLL